MKAAQTNPTAWNGILAGAPTIGGARVMAYRGYNARLWLTRPSDRIPLDMLPAIRSAALKACTPKARLIDGVAGDPRYCRYDPVTLLCGSTKNSSCLTAGQVDMLKALLAGPRDPATGRQIYPGVIPMAEGIGPLGSALTARETNDETKAPMHLSLVRSGFRDFAQQGAEWDATSFDVGRDTALFESVPIANRKLGPVYAADDPDLSAFKRHGGKLILYYGWLDSLDNAEFGRRYYEKVAARQGGYGPTSSFFRLFLVPGMDHCGMGDGANAFGQEFTPALPNDRRHNIHRALEAWVERGIEPNGIIATKLVGNDASKPVASTRPLCRYPTSAIFGAW